MTVNHGVPGSSPGEGAKATNVGWLFCIYMFCVYIIFSEKLNKFYIGTTDDFEKRLFEHNNGIYAESYTYRGIPWTKHFVINHLTSKTAYAIEKHIKSMKSSKYIENLIKYPEIIEKLKYKYDPVRSR